MPPLLISSRSKRMRYSTVQPIFHKLLHHCCITAALHHARQRADPGSTICGTASPSAPSSTITGRATPVPGSRSCRPTLVMPIPAPHTGTCRPRQNCWALRANGSNATWRVTHERARHEPAGVLHRPPHPPAPGQPEHGSILSRHPSVAACLRVGAARQGAVQTRYRRSRCTPDRGLPRPSGVPQKKRCADPQCPTCRDPLPVPLCRPAPS